MYYKQFIISLLLASPLAVTIVTAENSDCVTPVALKTNLLADAMQTPNLGIELRLSPSWTFDLSGEYNRWGVYQKNYKHWTVQPEIRYWFSEAFEHSFVGLHALGGEFNMGNLGFTWPLFTGELRKSDEYRYQGYFAGAGIGYGYAWSLSRHWGLSAELGVGYIYSKSDKLTGEGKAYKIEGDIDNHYFGPTKLAVNLIYKFRSCKNAGRTTEVVTPAPDVTEISSPSTPEVQPIETRLDSPNAPMPIFYPRYIFVSPQASGTKSRSVSGQAFIRFEPYQTNINPSLGDNKRELAKIAASIDAVRNNPDYSINSISIKGYSSPDGPYDTNKEISQQRAEQLCQYVRNLYSFDNNLMSASSVAEDWDGLANLVRMSSLLNRDAVLKIAESSITPDEKEARIKSRYPSDWERMRTEILPQLRHSDYNIDYIVKSYSTIEDVMEAYNTHPENLSMEEFGIAAKQYKPGTAEYMDVILTAQRYNQQDPIANINAANVYMSAGNYPDAQQCLANAGDSPLANYARGNFFTQTEDYQQALLYLYKARIQGVEEADQLIEQVNGIMHWQKLQEAAKSEEQNNQ